jgi:hypothetical protein
MVFRETIPINPATMSPIKSIMPLLLIGLSFLFLLFNYIKNCRRRARKIFLHLFQFLPSESGSAWRKVVEGITVEELWNHLVNAAPGIFTSCFTRICDAIEMQYVIKAMRLN